MRHLLIEIRIAYWRAVLIRAASLRKRITGAIFRFETRCMDRLKRLFERQNTMRLRQDFSEQEADGITRGPAVNEDKHQERRA